MLLKNLFISLSQNKLLNDMAQKYGDKLGAQTVVAGETIDEMIESIHELNRAGISATIDNLGEFVDRKEDATHAKEQILQVIDAIHENELDAHISLKPTQLGLGIDFDFCLHNLEEIVGRAHQFDIFVNIDMEDHLNLQPSFDLFDQLLKTYDNVGTVIQAYFYRAKDDVREYKDERLRLVKGAYKESEDVAYQNKHDIDQHFIELIEYHLIHGKFTSIGTHDHRVINHVKEFADRKGISKKQFEFQMLYGFRNELQHQLANEGYQFCTYVPFGHDWYGYFMRRLAERPQNINLVAKQVFTKKTNTMIAIGVGAFILGRLSKRRRKK